MLAEPWPVRAPDSAVWIGLYERAGDFHYVRVAQKVGRDAERPGDFHPELAGAEKAEQRVEAGLAGTGGSIGFAHVVEHDVDAHIGKQLGVFGDGCKRGVDLDVPAEGLDAPRDGRDRIAERCRGWSPAAQDVQANAAHAALVHAA